MTPDDESLQVTLARLEGKVDAALAHQGARVDAHADDIADHEARLRVQEARRTVSPLQLWTAFVSAVGAASAVVILIATLIK